MDQIPLLVDTINDAIRDTVRALGGSKVIGPALWPTKKAEAAARYLDDCLNPNRDHKLDIEEILTIARLGRDKGVHIIAAFVNMDIGYAPPTPVNPADQKAELQRQFIQGVGTLSALLKRVERLE
jgi:hypothetical protein